MSEYDIVYRTVELPGGGRITGREITVRPLFPWDRGADDTALTKEYRLGSNSEKSRTVYKFVGIPYAEPPVGEYRWKPAVYMQKPKTNPFRAISYGGVPWQTESTLNGYEDEELPYRPRFGIDNGHFNWEHSYHTEKSEDCLCLNIWSIDLGASLPVVVYIHGGGWVQNAACLFALDGGLLATKGVVYVTVEYRLSTFGMFYHPSFSDESGIKGNLALTDQQAALQWVHDNIASFGGDPDNVTIIGSSAGGASVLAHMETTEHTLFHKAWVISGGGNGVRTPLLGTNGSAEDRGVKFAENMRRNRSCWSDPTQTIGEMETNNGIADALRLGPSPQHILSYQNARMSFNRLSSGSANKNRVSSTNVYPFKDGTFLTYDRAAECFVAGTQRAIPMVIGFSTNEASVIGTSTYEDACSYNVRGGLASLLSGVTVEAALEALYPTLYPPATSDPDDPDWREIKRLGYRDIVYGHASRAIAAAHSSVSDAWWYVWDFMPSCFDKDVRGDASEGRLPGHTADRNFWNGNIDWSVKLYSVIQEAAINIQEIILSEYMMQRLANFAKNGDPSVAYDNSAYDFDLFEDLTGYGSTYPLNVTWDKYNTTDKNALLLTNNDGGFGLWYAVTMETGYLATEYDYIDAHRAY